MSDSEKTTRKKHYVSFYAVYVNLYLYIHIKLDIDSKDLLVFLFYLKLTPQNLKK